MVDPIFLVLLNSVVNKLTTKDAYALLTSWKRSGMAGKNPY